MIMAKVMESPLEIWCFPSIIKYCCPICTLKKLQCNIELSRKNKHQKAFLNKR